MRKLIKLITVAAVALAFALPGVAEAGKNGNGNGFPKGDHYNLNLIAKKSDPALSSYFSCPSAEKYQWDYYNDGTLYSCIEAQTGNKEYCIKADSSGYDVRFPSSQNVIFVPRNNDADGDPGADNEITILMQSGADRTGKGKKISNDYPALTVTDWCTESFHNDGVSDPPGDEAIVKLPENKNGYGVYARVTGKPVVGEAWKFLVPTLSEANDEYGNKLLFFGTIGSQGCIDSTGVALDRIDSTKGNGKGKGVKKATDLSCLFEFEGNVCYVNDLCYYCEDEDENYICESTYPDAAGSGNDAGFVCCTGPTGVYLDEGGDVCDPADDPHSWKTCTEATAEQDSCGETANYACVDPVILTYRIDGTGDICVPGTYEPAEDCIQSTLVSDYECADGGDAAVEPQCRYYEAGTWIFDIADFVDVLWKSQSSGAYVIQLRFYPL